MNISMSSLCCRQDGRTGNQDGSHVHQVRVPSLSHKIWLDEDNHADNRLDIVRDARACNDPPAKDTKGAH